MDNCIENKYNTNPTLTLKWLAKNKKSLTIFKTMPSRRIAPKSLWATQTPKQKTWTAPAFFPLKPPKTENNLRLIPHPIKFNLTSSDKNTTPSTPKIHISPIIMTHAQWCKATPLIYRILENETAHISAKTFSEGSLYIWTADVQYFKALQRSLSELKCEFHTCVLLEDKNFKVVLKGIPTGISDGELKSELINYNFDVKLVERYGPVTKPICMVILSHGGNTKEI